MNSDGKIYITISDKRGGNGGGDGVAENKESNVKKYGEMQMFSFMKSQAKQFVNYSIQNIGNFTGNYQMQRDIQSGISAINTLANIGTAFAVGGVAGGLIATAGAVINYGYQDYSMYIANKQQNRQIEMIRSLSGMNALLDGSRGTEG